MSVRAHLLLGGALIGLPAGLAAQTQPPAVAEIQIEEEHPDDRLIDDGGSASALQATDAGLFYGFATINGRELSQAGNIRLTNFKAFPGGVAKDKLVYRFLRAEDIEGALFGTLQSQTIRPLDLKKRRIELEMRGIYYPYADRAHQGIGKRVSASYLDQFDTGLGRIGVSFGLLVRRLPQPREFYDAGTNYVPCNSVGGTGDCTFTPGSANPTYLIGPSGTFRQERVDEKLNGYFGALQWQPGDRWNINLDVAHSRRVTTRYRNELGISDTQSGITPIEIGADGALLKWSGTTGLDLNAFRRQRDERYTGGGLTTEFRASSRLKLSTDLSYGRTFRTQTDTSAALTSNSLLGPGGQIGYTAVQGNAGFPAITFSRPVDLNDYSLFTLNPADRRGHEVRTDQISAARLDATYKLSGFLRSLRAGIRYSDHRRDAALHTYLSSGSAISAANAAAGMATCRIPTILDGFAGQTGTNIQSWAMYDPICLFNAFAGTTNPNTTLTSGTGGGIRVREQILAGYVMATFKGKAGSLPIDGNFGLRVVQTRSDTRVYHFGGTAADLAGVSDTMGPVVDLLPSLTITARPSDRIKITGGVGRTVLRSNIEGLGLRRILQATSLGTDVGRQRPLRSWNIDLQGQYRPGPDTILMLTLSDKILSTSAWPGDVLIPGGPLLPAWLVAGATQGSYIRSVEIGIDQKFRGLPAPFDALHLKASYLYSGSNFHFADPTAFDKSAPLTLFTAPAGVPALSRHVGSVVLAYERGPLELGVSYQYRSAYFRPTGLTPNRFLAPNTHVAVSASYDIGKHIEISALAANLTNQVENYTRPTDDSSGQTAYTGRLFSIGVRFRY